MMNVRTLSVVLIALFALLQYKLWLASDGFRQTWHLEKAIATQMDSNDALAKHNQLLARQVAELTHGQGTVEALAREELGMIKPGEQYYQFVN